jgi:Zn-dependent protease
MKSYINAGHIGKTEICLHYSLLLIVPIVMIRSKMNYQETLECCLFELMLYASIFLHEVGHMLTARYYGYNVHKIGLFLMGGFCLSEGESDQPMLNARIFLSGPLVNLCLAFICALPILNGFIPGLEYFSILNDSIPREFLVNILLMGLINSLLFIYNIIPIFPLDGGQMMLSVFHSSIGERKATLTTAVTGLGFSIVLTGIAIQMNNVVLLFFHLLLVIGPILLLVGNVKYLDSVWSILGINKEKDKGE